MPLKSIEKDDNRLNQLKFRVFVLADSHFIKTLFAFRWLKYSESELVEVLFICPLHFLHVSKTPLNSSQIPDSSTFTSTLFYRTCGNISFLDSA